METGNMKSLIGFLCLILPSLGMATDLENGKRVARQCERCHDLGPTKRNEVGPYLWGVVGRRAASVESYRYSDAHREAAEKRRLVWDEKTLDDYLKQTTTFIPGNRMSFKPTIVPTQSRKDLIGYLKTLSDDKIIGMSGMSGTYYVTPQGILLQPQGMGGMSGMGGKSWASWWTPPFHYTPAYTLEFTEDQVPGTVLKAIQNKLPGFDPTYIEAGHSASGKVMQYEFKGVLSGQKVDIQVSADGRRITIADKAQ